MGNWGRVVEVELLHLSVLSAVASELSMLDWSAVTGEAKVEADDVDNDDEDEVDVSAKAWRNAPRVGKGEITPLESLRSEGWDNLPEEKNRKKE